VGVRGLAESGTVVGARAVDDEELVVAAKVLVAVELVGTVLFFLTSVSQSACLRVTILSSSFALSSAFR